MGWSISEAAGVSNKNPYERVANEAVGREVRNAYQYIVCPSP
jgi:hypothetical protein